MQKVVGKERGPANFCIAFTSVQSHSFLEGREMVDRVATTSGDEDQLGPVNKVINLFLRKRSSPSTYSRWYTQGILCPDGTRCRLQVWYVGRTPHTTKAAVMEWLTSVTLARLGKSGGIPGMDDVSPEELRAAGLIDLHPARRKKRGEEHNEA